jgi:hypothetical protein
MAPHSSHPARLHAKYFSNLLRRNPAGTDQDAADAPPICPLEGEALAKLLRGDGALLARKFSESRHLELHVCRRTLHGNALFLELDC